MWIGLLVGLLLGLIVSLFVFFSVKAEKSKLAKVLDLLILGKLDEAEGILEATKSHSILAKKGYEVLKALRKQIADRDKKIRDQLGELKLSHAQIQSLYSKLQSIFKASTEYSIIATDKDGLIVEFNTGAERLFGFSAEEVIGRENIMITFPEQVTWEQVKREVEKSILESGKGEFEVKRKNKSGRVFPVLSVVTGIYGTNGEIAGVLEIARDITERINLERELKSTKEFLESIVESSVDVILATDRKGYFTFLNRAVKNVLGFEREELLGKHVSMLYPDGIDMARRIMKELREKGSFQNWEMKIYRKDGSTIQILTSAALLKDEQGNVVGTVGIFTDITERKRLEEELKRTQEELYQASKMRALGDLLAGVAHELNNPIMAAEAALELLKESFTDSKGQKRLELLTKCLERIGGLARHLKDFSRQAQVEYQDFDLKASLQSALMIAKLVLLADGIKINVEYESRLPKVKGDPYQFEQVFMNLISNARDAMASSPQKILTVRAYSREREGKKEVIAEIEDTGKGIPVEIREKIFDPFFTTKKVGEGSGLGLAICYGIVKRSGGRIEVESEEGKGSIFRVILPASLEW